MRKHRAPAPDLTEMRLAMILPDQPTPPTPDLPPAPVASCLHCGRPIVRPLAGPRAGIWLHTSGEIECRDRWGHPWPDLVAIPGGRRDDHPSEDAPARFRRSLQRPGGTR